MGNRWHGPTPAAERFWPKVNKNGPVHPKLGTRCWLWTGAIIKNGYGYFMFRHRPKHVVPAQRASWILATGAEPPSDIFVCHHCDTPLCVRPDHLFLGTSGDNTRDMIAKGRQRNWNREKTHCKHGHEFTEPNTYRYLWKGHEYRSCRECWTARKLTA